MALLLPPQAFASTIDAFFQPLGFLPGVQESLARDVSNDGSVVTGFNRYADHDEGFIWTQTDGMKSIGLMRGESIGRAVSGDGSTVVGYGAGEIKYGNEPLKYTNSVGIESLGVRPSPRVPGGQANDVSANGSTAVGLTISGEGYWEATVWKNGEPAKYLGFVSGTGQFTEATAISGNGEVVVGNAGSGGGFRTGAFAWSELAGMQLLHSINGSEYERAVDVSADGTRILGSAGAGGSSYGVIWDSAGDIVIPDFDPLKISGNGLVVLGQWKFQSAIWDSVSGVYNTVEDLLIRAGLGDQIANWKGFFATGISYDGTILTGSAVNPNGRLDSWIAKLPASVRSEIPEPSSASLLLVAGAFARWRARRSE